MLSTSLNVDEAALAAAACASEATSELIRFAREGHASHRTAFNDEVVSKLCEAMLYAIDIEGGPIFDQATQPEDFERESRMLAALDAAARAYLAGAEG